MSLLAPALCLLSFLLLLLFLLFVLLASLLGRGGFTACNVQGLFTCLLLFPFRLLLAVLHLLGRASGHALAALACWTVEVEAAAFLPRAVCRDLAPSTPQSKPGPKTSIILPHLYVFGWGLSFMILATLVVFELSHLRRVWTVPTVTGTRPLRVAILEAVVVVGPSYLRRVSTGMRLLGGARSLIKRIFCSKMLVLMLRFEFQIIHSCFCSRWYSHPYLYSY